MGAFDLDSEWENYCNNDTHSMTNNDFTISEEDDFENVSDIPKCSDIYISTKTKISYLSKPLDLKDTFWNIPIVPYHIPCNGIIKKQMKFNSSNEEELQDIQNRLRNVGYSEEHIITRIVNPSGRIKFRDIRKVSVGICKKDILSYRIKKKSAFYNCFVVIIRIKHNNIFREIHVKVFNTGKLEIPGIQSDELLDDVLGILITSLKAIVSDDISYMSEKNETVLINSNFNCGFYINREKLYNILKYKYHINSNYDPCSYPGIQCKFYYNKSLKVQNGQQTTENSQNNEGIKVSFMIFRTGSVLIVGKCNESLLNDVYIFIKDLLSTERQNIIGTAPPKNELVLSKKRKIRKKVIILE